jgi:hypothetical protein
MGEEIKDKEIRDKDKCMVRQKFTGWLLPVCCFCWANLYATEQPPAIEADMALLEFLGSMEEEADEWEEFIEFAADGISPRVAEVDHED